jgi:hypothetical protein
MMNISDVQSSMQRCASSKVARADCRKLTCDGLHIPAAWSTRQPTYLQPHALPTQSSTAVTQFATNLPTPEGWTVWLTGSATRFEPQVRQTRGQCSMTARPITHSATQTNTIFVIMEHLRQLVSYMFCLIMGAPHKTIS